MKQFIAIICSMLCTLLVAVPAFAEDTLFITASELPSISKGSDIAWGNSVQINIGNTGACIQGYQPTCRIDNYPVSEKIGLFNHVINPGDTHTYGNIELRWVDNTLAICVNGTAIDSCKTNSTQPIRYGVIPLVAYSQYNELCFYFCPQALWDKLSDFNYILTYPEGDGWNRYVKDSPYTSYQTLDYTSNSQNYEPWRYGFTVNLSEYNIDVSLGDNTVPSDPETGEVSSSLDVYFDYITTCPACGSRNVSYNWNYFKSMGSSLAGAVAYTFKCNDCGEKWYDYRTPAQGEAFNAWLAGSSLVSSDPKLPLPEPQYSPVELPSDINSFTDYIQYAFSSLEGFTTAFNAFFQSVLLVLPAPIMTIVFLGVGFVIVLGILKVIRG